MKTIKIRTEDDAAKAAMSITLSAVAVHTSLLRALAKLDEYAAAGYPSTTSGAAPSNATPSVDPHTGLPDPALTSVERAAGRPDLFAAQHRDLVRRIERIEAELREASRVVLAHASPGRIRPGDVSDTLQEIWCPIHARIQHLTPKAVGRSACRWCCDFRRAEGLDPPKQLLELHASGKKVTAADVDRALGRKTS